MSQTQTHAEARHERRERYERLQRVIDLNTGGQQPPAARLTSVLELYRRISSDRDAARAAYRAAVANDDVVVLQDPDGTRRIALTTEPALVEVLEWVAAGDEPDRSVIARLNELLDEVRGGS